MGRGHHAGALGAARLGIAVLAIIVLVAVALTDESAKGARTGGALLLPDLDMAMPDGMKVRVLQEKGRTHYRIGFISAAENIGAGPLMIHAARTDIRSLDMRADQVIDRADGDTATIRNVGAVRYNRDRTHQHWHYLGFMTYELRRASDYRQVRPGRKTGFCLGDRYKAPRDRAVRLSAEVKATRPATPVFVEECADGSPEATSVDEGISVGYGDVYSAFRDGQEVDVTGLPEGQYVLVHRVNQSRRLRESSYANDASSLVFDLHWPNGPNRKPTVELRGRCGDSDRCEPQW